MKHTGPPWPITGVALLFYMEMSSFLTENTHLWAFIVCYGDSFAFL
jgi:hypothetical protein